MKRLTKEAKAARNITASARAKGLNGNKFARYVYGALNNGGLLRGNKVTPRGRSPAHRGR